MGLLAEGIQDQAIVVLEGWRVRKDGSQFWATAVITALYDGDRTLRGFGVVTRDTTTQRAADQAVALKSRRLLAAESIGHVGSWELDLATQTVVWTDTLCELHGLRPEDFGESRWLEAFGEQVKEGTEVVRLAGAMIDVTAPVDAAREMAEARLAIEHRRFDLRACVERALDLSGAATSAKELEIIADIDEDCPAAVIGDVTRVRQVLVNLLSNAVKFTTAGQVVVAVEPTDDPCNGEKVALHFAVSDTGIGIPAHRLADLFDASTQVDGSTTRTYGGTGLGLAISRRLVEAMGATLKVDSISGAGSTFHFSVAFDRAAPTGAPGDALPARLGGRSALLVDDNPTSRRVLMRMLKAWGMRVTAAASPQAGILVVDGGGTFDVIIVDRHMPVMSGVDLAVVLRQAPPTMHLPFILLDSHTDRLIPDERQLFSAVLTKPVRASELLQTLSTVLPKDAAARPRLPPN